MGPYVAFTDEEFKILKEGYNKYSPFIVGGFRELCKKAGLEQPTGGYLNEKLCYNGCVLTGGDADKPWTKVIDRINRYIEPSARVTQKKRVCKATKEEVDRIDSVITCLMHNRTVAANQLFKGRSYSYIAKWVEYSAVEFWSRLDSENRLRLIDLAVNYYSL